MILWVCGVCRHLASLNPNEFNIFDSVIQAVEVDGDGVCFLVFMEETWFAKRRLSLVFVSPTYCRPHLLQVHYIGCVTLGVGLDIVRRASAMTLHFKCRFDVETRFTFRAGTLVTIQYLF